MPRDAVVQELKRCEGRDRGLRKVESLYTNPDGSAQAILHGARSSLVDGQMRHLTHDVFKTLDEQRASSAFYEGESVKPSSF